ncbi:DHS-like NAD/FAD-binding domain-containing protein [Scheffersomyces amazonensis]|uniref:DHS-like NAD/FAD-binding domain-containing protein n=1 Tax=Scheffersomyces amazonensis TaxID=1078765 RepID=UPI00315CC911
MITIDLLNQKIGVEISGEDSINLNEAIKHIFKSKKATVLTGAGISCNAGIPDFRSSDGLYNLVKSKYPKTIVRGQDLFDISLFRDEISLSLFCTFMESLYQYSLKAQPTETHKFIKLLKDKNKLLRCYTQNIDSLEKSINLNMGINLNEFDKSKTFNQSWKNLDVVQLHGNLHKLSCTNCFSNFDWNEKYRNELASGLNPKCDKCYEKYEERLYSGKRLTGNVGILRPDIVLYGEHHPQADILAQGLNVDLRAGPDLLIVMGTSLKVDGVKKLVKSLSTSIHNKGGKVVFVNKTPLSKQWHSYIDYEILSDCDNFVRILKKEIPDLFLTQEQLDSKKLKHGMKENLPSIKTEKCIKKTNIKKETKKASGVKQESKASKIKSEKAISMKQVAVKKESVDLISSSSSESEIEEALTPPITPTKPKKRPALKRKSTNIDEPRKRLKFDLPTPLSSFNGDGIEIANDDYSETTLRALATPQVKQEVV